MISSFLQPRIVIFKFWCVDLQIFFCAPMYREHDALNDPW